MKTIIKFLESSEEYYSSLNGFISKGATSLIDVLYPNHDGVEDAYTYANMAVLLDRLSAIKNGIEIAISHLGEAISLEENS
jgi:hypothetical protein